MLVAIRMKFSAQLRYDLRVCPELHQYGCTIWRFPACRFSNEWPLGCVCCNDRNRCGRRVIFREKDCTDLSPAARLDNDLSFCNTSAMPEP